MPQRSCRNSPHAALRRSEWKQHIFSFSSAPSNLSLQGKRKILLSLHRFLQPFTVLWPLHNVTFNSSNTQMSIAGQCLFLEYTRGSKFTFFFLSFSSNQWNSRPANKYQHYFSSDTCVFSIQSTSSCDSPFDLWELGMSPPSVCYDYSRHGWLGLA